MNRWHLTLGLSLVTLAAAALAPRLMPSDGASEATLAVTESTPATPATVATPAPPRQIDIVLAIDTSGSMDALIDSVRTRLWDIVNTIDAEDPDATLRVGLLAYGSPGYGSESGYVKVVSPLSEDLDALYTRVFALRTTGGDEYVGGTILAATEQLDWSTSRQPDDRRLLFVAGNEEATQGPQDAVEMARQAREGGILVSTLFAGDVQEGRNSGWEAVALEGGGRFLAIDAADSAVAVQATPYDQRIQELNTQINTTYVAYGASGTRRLNEMKDNDNRARAMGVGALAGRAAAKSGKKFKTASWDLVEAVDKDPGLLDGLSDEALPSELRNLSKADQKAAIAEKAKQRTATKRELAELARQRQEHLATGRKGDGLDAKMGEALDELL